MKYLLLLGSFFLAANTAGQRPKNAGIIVGSVWDAQLHKPLAGASIQYSRKGGTDSAFVQHAFTAQSGEFQLQDLAYGYYTLRISMVGFGSLVMDSIFLRPERYDFDLGELQLGPISNTLPQVVVFVEKPMLENNDGKVTFNAGQSALSGGSSTAELLRTLPLVSADPNGKILLRGKEPRILIDDKPVELNGQQLADLLESLPGGSIEKIELLQNPPPEYGTETGGVINIVTKKGKVGFTGRLTLSAGTRGEANLGLFASYRTRQFTFSATVAAGAGLLVGYNNSYRSNFFSDSANRLITEGDFDNRNLRPNIRLQADYSVHKNHQLSLVVQGSHNLFHNEAATGFQNWNRYNDLWRYSQRSVDARGGNYSMNPQLSWNWKGKRSGENLQVVSGITHGMYQNDREFFQQFFQPPSLLPSGPDSSQQQQTRNSAVHMQTRLNYNRPLFHKTFTLQVGAGMLSTKNDNDLQSFYLDKTLDTWRPAERLTISFVFNQWVYYARAGFTWQLKKGWRLVSYVQPEWTTYQLKNKTEAIQSGNAFLNWMPGATLRKDLNKNHHLSLVYRKSIRRPAAAELNPAIDYADPYNLRFGNPDLTPSLAHHFDLNYGFNKGKSFFNASAGFNQVQAIIASIRSLQPDGRTFVTYQNIASRKEYELAVWSGYSFSKLFRLNGSAGYTYHFYTQADRLKLGYINAGSFYTTLNYTLTFSPVFSMDGSLRFSSMADPQGRNRSNINSNMGVQYKFFDRRLIASFNAIDPFTPQQLTTFTSGPNFNLENFRSSKTRNFRLTIAWQLNKIVSATKQKS